MASLVEHFLQDPVELENAFNKGGEDMELAFQALSGITNTNELQYLLESVGSLLPDKVFDSLTSAESSQSLKVYVLTLLTHIYSVMPEKQQNAIRSHVLSLVFATSAPKNVFQTVLAVKVLAEILIFHKEDEQILTLLNQYMQFLDTHYFTLNLSVISALLNIIPLFVDFYMDDLISLLVRLSEACNKLPDDLGFRRQCVRKTIKNVLCAILKSHGDLAEKVSFGIMDCLINQIHISKPDTHQFYQILQTRGFNYNAGKSSAELSALQLSNEQISQAVVAALQHYANTNHANIPQFILPADANISIHVVIEIIISALQSFNPLAHADNGLQNWSQIISSIQHFTQQALQIQIQMLSQVASVMDTSKSAGNKFIPTTQPFVLTAAPAKDVEETIKMILGTLLDTFSTVPCDKPLETDGSHILLKGRGKKRKLDDDEVVRFKSSRAYWSMLLSRLFANPVFANYKTLLINYLLDDFTNRYDLAVRWLWESFYVDYVISLKPKGETPKAPSEPTYSQNLLIFFETMFAAAESALPNSEKFIPWLKTNNNSTLFRAFLMALPKIEINSDAFQMILKYLDVEFSTPMPTPIQLLQYTFALETCHEIVIQKPALRELFPVVVSNIFKPSKRSYCLDIMKVLWNGEGFAYEAGFFVPLYPAFESLVLTLLDFLKAPHPPNIVNKDDPLLMQVLEIAQFGQTWTPETIESIFDCYIKLLPRKPELVKHLYDLIIHVNEENRQAVTSLVISYFISLGMPKDETELSFKLLNGINEHIEHDMIRSFLIEIVKVNAHYPPVEGIAQPSTLTRTFTRLVLDMIQKHGLDPELYIMVIYGEGFTRDEMYLALHHLTSLLPPQYTQYVNQILRPPSLLSPVELLLFINNCCEVAGKVINPKRSADAITLLIDASASGDIQMLTNKSIAAAISLMMSNYASGVYPLLFMKTVLAYLVRHGNDVRGFVLSQVLAPLCNLRLLWLAARDKLSKAEETRVGKVMWHSFILCLKECRPNSFMLVMQLQKDRLALVLEKAGDDYKAQFLEWCESEKSGARAKKVTEILGMYKK